MEGVRIYEDAELNTALSKSNTPSSPDAIKKVIIPAVYHLFRSSCNFRSQVTPWLLMKAYAI
jgi:hypothetical protein